MLYLTGRNFMEQAEKERKSLYILGWLLLLLAAVYLLAERFLHAGISRLFLPCIFHAVTGFYCPGCGGTRAVRQLLEGHILKSLYYHPLVFYGAVLYAWFMISNSMEYLSKGRLRVGMRYHKRYVIAAIIILALNFVIKNGAMLIWHYPMIP